MDVAKDKDGRLKLINTTQPVGVVPSGARYWYEDVEEDDGSVHTYLFVETLLWKRQEAYDKIKEDGIVDESMEITIKNAHMEDSVLVIDSFEFTAFCLLGTAEPCYESAALMLCSQNEFQQQFTLMMTELKEQFSTEQLSDGVVNKGFDSEGGKALDEKRALMAQYGLTEDSIDFELDEFSIEELTAKFEELTSNPGEEPAEPVVDNENFALAEQFKSELVAELSAEKVETCWGEMERYWYVDYDAETSEVYCYDSGDWNLYGFTYSMNGDHVVVNFESKTRKKYAIVNFDEGEQTSVFAEVFSIVSQKFESDCNELKEKFAQESARAAAMESELTALRTFKENAEQAAAAAVRETVLEQFADLEGNEAFEALRNDCGQYSAEELEEKCYALRGRFSTMTFSAQHPKSVKIPAAGVFGKDVDENEPYGGAFLEFGKNA
jgi:hypothetical protein